ncbi:MAG: hypothetical protein NTW19_23120 [Planctomycetota bacterium]|nr:hypothetical protein [Planctomycetota bacterium]
MPRSAKGMTLFVLIFALAGRASGETVAERVPTPDTAAQREALKVALDVYKAEIAKAKRFEEKVAVSRKLLQAGNETQNDPAGRYALYVLARDVAVDAGSIDGTLAALQAMAAGYAGDPLPAKIDALTRLTTSDRLQTDAGPLYPAAAQLIDEAVAADRYDIARRASALAMQVTAKDRALTAQATARVREAREVETAYAAAEKAQATLDKSPDDAAANLALGRFRCLYKGDWKAGLSQLALDNDAELKALATADLKGPAAPEAQATLADGWWAQSEKATGVVKRQLQFRAAKWYGDAAPRLTGLTKAKAEKRMKEAATVPPPAEIPRKEPEAAVRHGRELLTTFVGNGAVEKGLIVLRGKQRVRTTENFKPPILFQVVAQTDSTNLRLAYAAEQIIFNWEKHPDELRIDGGPAAGRHTKGAGSVPVNKWVEIDLEVTAEQMVIRVNGDERFRTAADFSKIEQPLTIFPAGSTVTVQSVKVRTP